MGNPMKFLQGMIQHFSRLKDDDITPEQYLNYANSLQKNADIEESERKQTIELAYAYKTYEELKAKNGVMDFSDLISNTLHLFRSRPHILKNYQEQFTYILVDDDQCLLPSTLISTPEGEKEIQYIKENDSVLTGVGKGYIATAKVTKVFKNQKDTKFITIKTKSGKEITATAN